MPRRKVIWLSVIFVPFFFGFGKGIIYKYRKKHQELFQDIQAEPQLDVLQSIEYKSHTYMTDEVEY